MSAVAGLEQSREPSATGLTTAEAARRLASDGPNDAVASGGDELQLRAVIADPLVLVLLLAAIAAGIAGDVTDAAIIVVLVALSVALNLTQTWRSKRAADRLRAGVAATAMVIRDGREQRIAARDVVRGDLLLLSAGELIAADAVVVEATDLHLQQAALTGESLPVEKSVTGPPAALNDASQAGLVFLGTSVSSGVGKAEVIRTGGATLFGSIGASLQAKRPETEFERGTRQFSFLIARTILLLVLFVGFTSVIQHREPLQSMLFAVALAVGLAPEFLPMIRSVTLARGAVHMANRKVIVRHLAAIQNLGSVDILCSDKTGTLTRGEMSVDATFGAAGGESQRVLELAAINSALQTGIRSAIDEAVLARAGEVRAEKVDEVPFDFERRVVSVIAMSEGSRLLVCKGAPEAVMQRCVAFDRAPVLDAITDCGRRGLRVIAVAWKQVGARTHYSPADENGLTFEGLIAFGDPPLEDAPRVVEALRRDGVAVKILSGDAPDVVAYVCERVGLDGGDVVTGDAVERADEMQLARMAERATAFARLSPGQKTRIIRALKSRGHVVGFLGDGINDAPSLRAADVGISVANATGVARETAEIILLERSLAVLHAGIVEGRKAFGNVMKFVLMETSSSFGNTFSMAIAALVLPFLPMLPTQILVNNFLYDLAQVTIPGDRVDATYVVKPQRWDVAMIRRFMLLVGPASSLFDFLTFWALLHWFSAGEKLFHTGWFVESLLTQVLVLLVIRTAGNPFRSRPSAALLTTVLIVACAAILLPYTPFAMSLGFVPLPPAYFAFLFVATSAYLGLVEMVKRHVMQAI